MIRSYRELHIMRFLGNKKADKEFDSERTLRLERTTMDVGFGVIASFTSVTGPELRKDCRKLKL